MSGDEAQTLRAAEIITVLGEPAVSTEPLPHARRNTATRAVWRVRTAHKAAVVKVISTDPGAAGVPGADRSSHPYHAAREPLLYERGLPDSYADAGIAMPRLLAAVERPGAVALWLEDLAGSSGADLTVADYAATGLRLGRAHGSELAHPRSESDFPWSDNFLGV